MLGNRGEGMDQISRGAGAVDPKIEGQFDHNNDDQNSNRSAQHTSFYQLDQLNSATIGRSERRKQSRSYWKSVNLSNARSSCGYVWKANESKKTSEILKTSEVLLIGQILINGPFQMEA
jgi:hypothetical protein